MALPTQQGTLDAAYHSYAVGAYYFSGWSHGLSDNITPRLLNDFPNQEPLIGWYDDSQTQVDRTIDQAANAGIDFFAFDWYDLAQSQSPTDKTLNEGLGYYLTSPERHRLKFCLLFVDYPPFVPSASMWPSLVSGWLAYFLQPDYVRVNGKPLFLIFSPEYMYDMFDGAAGVHRALDYLRVQARAFGLPGVTVAVAATVTQHANPIHIQELLNAEGYDVTTGYSYHGLGDEQPGVPAPYENLVAENVAMWNRVPSHVPLPYIPVITSGFDLRYSARQNEQEKPIIYAGRTPDKFACYAVLARHWIDTHPAQTTGERIVLIYAWTELTEGGAIIPTRGDGYGYSRAVATVFGTAHSSPATPAQCRSP